MELPITEGFPSPCVLFGFVLRSYPLPKGIPVHVFCLALYCGVTHYRRVSQSMCFVWLCVVELPVTEGCPSPCPLFGFVLWSYPLPKGIPVHVFCLAL